MVVAMTTSLHLTYFNDLKAWAKKHRRALLITVGVSGVGMGSYYIVSLLKATTKSRAEEEQVQALLRRAADDGAEAHLQSHFESIQRISNSTTLPSVLPHLKARLVEMLNLSGLTDKLMSSKEDPKILNSRES